MASLTGMNNMSEEEQMRLAIEASLVDMHTSSTPSVEESSSANATVSNRTTDNNGGKKKGKKRILRLIHNDGLHRMKKFDFDNETMLMLKQRIIRSMNLSWLQPNQITVKLDKGSSTYFGSSYDHLPISEAGIVANGQKIWISFPQPKLDTLAPFLGKRFLKGNSECGSESLETSKIIGIYFSAHWCSPCRSFTPKLVKAYNSLKQAGAPLEILFVSCDRDEQSMKDYFASMPWLAFPLRDDRGSHLNDKFQIRGIPSLVFIGTSGSVLSTSGRQLIDQDPTGQAILNLIK